MPTDPLEDLSINYSEWPLLNYQDIKACFSKSNYEYKIEEVILSNWF